LYTTGVRQELAFIEQVKSVIFVIDHPEGRIMLHKQFLKRHFIEWRETDCLEDFVQTRFNPQFLLGNSNQKVGADGHPDLKAHRILRGADKLVDAQMLFDPAKEEFDLPPTPVEMRNNQRRKMEDVGEEYQRSFLFEIVKPNPPQGIRVIFTRLRSPEANRLVAPQPGAFVHEAAFDDSKSEVRLGSDDEKGTFALEAMQSLEVGVSPVHNVDRSRFDRKLVDDVHLMHQPVGYDHERWDRAAQIQQGVEFDGSLGGAEMRPGKNAQTKIYHCGIERVDRLRQFYPKAFIGIELASLCNQGLRPIGIDPPIARLVGVRQRASGDAAAKSHLIEQRRSGLQTGYDIAQAVPIGQLGKSHRQPLIVAAETAATNVAAIFFDATAKNFAVSERHNLCKDCGSRHFRNPRKLSTIFDSKMRHT